MLCNRQVLGKEATSKPLPWNHLTLGATFGKCRVSQHEGTWGEETEDQEMLLSSELGLTEPSARCMEGCRVHTPTPRLLSYFQQEMKWSG